MRSSNATIAVWNVSVARGLAYVADVDSLKIIDAGDPTSPALSGYYLLADPVHPVDSLHDVCARGDLAFVANGEGGLWILRYTGPFPPQPTCARPAWRLYW